MLSFLSLKKNPCTAKYFVSRERERERDPFFIIKLVNFVQSCNTMMLYAFTRT